LNIVNDEIIESGKKTLERLKVTAPNVAKHFKLKSTTSSDIPFKLVFDIELVTIIIIILQ
jgi:hypothetical protein